MQENSEKFRYYVENFLHSIYLERLIKERLSRPISVVSLAVPSSIIEDDAFIFEKMIVSKKTPAVLVCCIAPRDFLIHPSASFTTTPVKELLKGYRPLAGYLKFCAGPINQFLLFQYYFNKKIPSDSVETWRQNFAFNVKTKVKVWSSRYIAAASQSSGRPLSILRQLANIFREPQIDKKNKEVKPQPSLISLNELIRKPADLADLKYFPSVYSDQSLPFMNQEFEALEKLLIKARQEQVPIVLVLMPVSSAHKQLFSGNICRQYENHLAKLIALYQPKVLRPDADGSWPLSNFSDSAHLNLYGAQELFKAMADELAENQALRNR